MSRKVYTRKHWKQVIKVIISLFFLSFIYLFLIAKFGKDSFITKFFYENGLITSYSIVGIILVILFFNGIWVGRIKSKKLYSLVSFILFILSIIPLFSQIFPTALQKFKNSWVEILIIIGYIIGSILILIALVFLMRFIVKSISRKKLDSQKNTEQYSKLSSYSKLNNLENKFDRFSHFNNGISSGIIDDVEQNTDTNTDSANVQPIFSDDKRDDFDFTIYPPISDAERSIAKRICPKCGAKLCARTNSYDGSFFLGCSQFGKTGCDFTINYPEYYAILKKVSEFEK